MTKFIKLNVSSYGGQKIERYINVDTIRYFLNSPAFGTVIYMTGDDLSLIAEESPEEILHLINDFCA